MFVLINKPAGWTSHDVVAYIRNNIRKLKVGHAGTLDPFATGLLIVGVGREATKKLDEFKNLPKTYVATLKLGQVSDTFDKTGKIEEYNQNITKIQKNMTSYFFHILIVFCSYFFHISSNNKIPTLININSVIKKFIGPQRQLPPMYSAKKIKGQRLYKLARRGINISRKKTKIEIFEIKILAYNYPLLKIKIQCSSGTYIRTLAHDIGRKLGCGAYCEKLERTAIGEHKLELSTPTPASLLIK